MREVVLPYLTASAQHWRLGQWSLLTESGEEPLPDVLDAWDYSVSLALSCDVTIDVTAIRVACLLDAEDPVRILCTWEASSTGIRDIGFVHALPSEGEIRIQMLLELDGSLLGGRLTLERQIILGEGGRSPDALAAHEPGSVLLREDRAARKTVILEGEAARFPTEVIGFRDIGIAEPDALWHLEFDAGDLEQSPLSAMRLYLNAEHSAIRRALKFDDELGAIVRSVMQWDVARNLVHGALDNEEFIEAWGGFPEGTLGATLEALIGRFWHGETGESLRARRTANPARFETQLQARMRLLEMIE